MRRDIEVGIAADAAGFDTYWAPEHHCLEEYSHGSSSHLACLAVGVQTKRIRVVTGIFNICPPINHPVRVAEQIAYIDVVTNGRVELGTGRGSGSTEVNTFGLSSDETRDMWEEAIHAIPQMWTQELFSWQGKYFSVPERCIIPRVVQKPHPPLWVTATNPGRCSAPRRWDRRRDVQLRRPEPAAARRDVQVHHPEGEAGRRVHVRQDHDDRTHSVPRGR
jgi:alkanesulfonate monooxygenase SsuD/methylene tetrahydromethanopterin reductase-like flavin-dependent oxidoreductase (luciferase family)